MVIKYNSSFCSRRLINKSEVKQLTPENIRYLLSLGLKLKNNGAVKRRGNGVI